MPQVTSENFTGRTDMSWALYFHADSDSLFWSEEWPNEGTCEDVTYQTQFQDAAASRGLKCPGPVRERNDENDGVEVTSIKSSGIAGAII